MIAIHRVAGTGSGCYLRRAQPAGAVSRRRANGTGEKGDMQLIGVDVGGT